MTAILSIMVPVPVTDSMLISSTLPEADYPVYDNAHAYALGDRCIAEHRIYESQFATANTGHPPTDPVNQFGTVVYWLDVGPTNRMAMFDNEVSSQSTGSGSITVVIMPGAINTIYLGGMQAADLSVVARDTPGGNVIFTFDGTLEASKPADYYPYFFSGFSFLKSKVLAGIPAYLQMELTVTLTNGVSGTVLCGLLAFGLLQRLGRTQQGAKAKPKTYSYVDIDAYGKATIRRGKAATDVTASAVIDSGEARLVQAILASALDIPCLMSCSSNPDYSGLNNFGLISGEVVYKTPETSEVSITSEGLI
ncbi:hypothetical protein ACEN9F_30650 [Duganella sp. CT11-25]|uniref:hypothetical protein n=1 Tax=unclassified Duganella TaxID=2636909 RepID=UPI0039AF950D